MCNGGDKADERHPLDVRSDDEYWTDKSINSFLDAKEADWRGKHNADNVYQMRHMADDGNKWDEDVLSDYPIKYRPSRKAYNKYMNQKK